MIKILKIFTLLCLSTCGILPMASGAENLTTEEKTILATVDQHFEDQLIFLEKVVNINSGTLNLAGVRDVGNVFGAELEKLGFTSSWINMPASMERAGHLHSELKGHSGRRLLLMGHLDTIFPKDSPYQTFERQGGRLTGPGVADMKNGNVIILYALKALHQNGLLKDRQVNVFLTGDEEKTGLPLKVNRKTLTDLAQRSDAALNFEAGRQDQAVIARRGTSNWSLEVTGKRAHSSGIFKPASGAGAIFETARILDRFYAQIRGEPYVTFNPGVISGGTAADFDKQSGKWSSFGKTNVIAQTVHVHGDIRYISSQQKERVHAKMLQIVATNLPHTTAKLEFIDKYPPMPLTDGNTALLALLNQTSIRLGYGPVHADDPGNRGAADISFVAPYVASLDGLGAWGGGSHTPHEWLDVKGFKMATKRAALYLYHLTQTQDQK